MKNALVFLYESQDNAEATLEQLMRLDGIDDYEMFAIVSYDKELLEILPFYPFNEIFVHKTRGMASHRAFAKSFKDVFDKVVIVEAGKNISEDLLEEKNEIYSRDTTFWRDAC